MISKVLVPLDRLEIAEAGLVWAEHAAKRSGATLRMVTVLDGPAVNGRQRKAEAYLERHWQRLRAGGLTVEFNVLQGEPGECILQEAKAADITVMTSGTTRWIISPVLDQVMARMERPVVVVRGAVGKGPAAPSFERVLVPVDSSPYAAEVLATVAAIARDLGSKVILYHSVAPVGKYQDPSEAPPGIARMMEEELAAARAFLGGTAQRLHAEGLAVETVVSHAPVAGEIVRMARKQGAGLIAMATRGRERLESRITGSVANAIVESTDIPCLLIRTSGAGS